MDKHVLVQQIERNLDNPIIVKSLIQQLTAIDKAQRQHKSREIQIRELAGTCGYRIMHRGKGQYWLMLAKPMSLDEIESWIDQQNEQPCNSI